MKRLISLDANTLQSLRDRQYLRDWSGDSNIESTYPNFHNIICINVILSSIPGRQSVFETYSLTDYLNRNYTQKQPLDRNFSTQLF